MNIRVEDQSETVRIPREPTEHFLADTLEALKALEEDPSFESRRQTIAALRNEFRVRLAALRLQSDSFYQQQVLDAEKRRAAHESMPCLSADEVDQIFAGYLGD
jgi:hypothetical protein